MVLPTQAADEEVRPLYLSGVTLNGVHSYFGQNWVTLEVTITNPNTMARDARVVVFYSIRPDVQYARDIWVPPRTTLATWMLMGPAPEENLKPGAPPSRTSRTREIQSLIYDRTGGQDRRLPPAGDYQIRSRLAGYREPESQTCLFLDSVKTADIRLWETPEPPVTDDALDLVRAFRANASRSLSDHVLTVNDSFLPPIPEGFDGVEQFVLAGGKMVDDPPGLIALRQWLERGGKLWVMLDRTDPDLVARILGGNLDFHVVDRTSLTEVRFVVHRPASPDGAPPGTDPTTREFEKPVDFVRVKVGKEYSVLSSVNGWPASFIRNVGLGKLIVTTLGARGWCRPRLPTDVKSPFEYFPNVPITVPTMEQLSEVLVPLIEPNPLPPADLVPIVSGEIGYSVVSVSWAGIIFGVFLLVLLIFGIGLRKWGRMEVLGWIGPAAALLAGGVFLALGESSRRSIPPTVGVAQIVAINPKSSDQAVTGLLGFYRPDSGPTNLSSSDAGSLDLDMGGLEGQTRRFVMTDIDQWHWENLALPAGVRLGPFQSLARMDEKVSAAAHFGPNGLEGKVNLGGFHGIGDALIQAPSQRAFAIRIQPDGAFTLTAEDLLPAGHFISGAVLSDIQQKRQAIYNRLLTGSKIGRRSDDSLLVASAEPIEVPFTFEKGIRPAGSAVISVPLELERTKPDTLVTIPPAFMAFRRITSLGAMRSNMEGQHAIEQELRFQVPTSVLPLKIEKARLIAKVDIPMRQFTIKGHSGDKGTVVLGSYQSPVETLELEITRKDLLSLDDQGGLRIDIEMGDPSPDSGETPPKWIIHSMEMEIVGRTLKGD
jgi:hypothetical protein